MTSTAARKMKANIWLVKKTFSSQKEGRDSRLIRKRFYWFPRNKYWNKVNLNHSKSTHAHTYLSCYCCCWNSEKLNCTGSSWVHAKERFPTTSILEPDFHKERLPSYSSVWLPSSRWPTVSNFSSPTQSAMELRRRRWRWQRVQIPLLLFLLFLLPLCLFLRLFHLPLLQQLQHHHFPRWTMAVEKVQGQTCLPVTVWRWPNVEKVRWTKIKGSSPLRVAGNRLCREANHLWGQIVRQVEEHARRHHIENIAYETLCCVLASQSLTWKNWSDIYNIWSFRTGCEEKRERNSN